MFIEALNIVSRFREGFSFGNVQDKIQSTEGWFCLKNNGESFAGPTVGIFR